MSQITFVNLIDLINSHLNCYSITYSSLQQFYNLEHIAEQEYN